MPYPAPKLCSTTASSVCTGTVRPAPTTQVFSSRSKPQGTRQPEQLPARGRSTAQCIRLAQRAVTFEVFLYTVYIYALQQFDSISSSAGNKTAQPSCVRLKQDFTKASPAASSWDNSHNQTRRPQHKHRGCHCMLSNITAHTY